MGSVEAAVLDDAPVGANDKPQIVALKRILRAEGSDPQRIEMFLREARLTTLLDHPNVVRALSYGECSGELFLAMEYIAGEPLSRLVSLTRERGEQLPPPVVAYILAEACEGLHAAHELKDVGGESLNVVHRDVSPHNVMVGFDGTVKLLDFGVAKMEALESAGRTKTGEVKGKTAYMSPEQAMGEPIDRRSDLYSVGTVLYECLTGRRMWGVGTDLDVLRRLALDEPPSLAADGKDVPPELARLHAKLIARDPDLRPADARAVAVELRAYLASTGVSVDADLLRAMMTRLFSEDGARREGAIQRALTNVEATPTGSVVGNAVQSAHESGAVFATDGGVVSQVHTRRAPRAVASGALLVLLVVFGGVALWYRDSRSAAPVTLVPPPAASSLVVSPSASPWAAVSVAPPAMTPLPVMAPPAIPNGSMQKLLTPRPADDRRIPEGPRPPLHSAAPQPRPPSSAAGTASSSPAGKPPEPPDVDPTPF